MLSIICCNTILQGGTERKNVQTSVLFEQVSSAVRVRDTGWLHEASHLLVLDAAGETAVVVTSNHSS